MSRAKKESNADGGLWIQKATQNKGALHRALDVPMDKKISEKKLDKAVHSKSLKMRRRANLANTLRGMHSK